MIELEVVYVASRWIEIFDDFDTANHRWNVLVDRGASVYHSTNFSPEIILDL